MERPHPLSIVVKAQVLVLVFIWRVFNNLDQIRDIGLAALLSRHMMSTMIITGIVIVILLIMGFLSWKYTTFVIDDTQIRIESTLITHESNRIPFSKIQSVEIKQPIMARILRLGELTIDAGASSSGHSIAYLPIGRARELRDYLMRRARNQKITVAESRSTTTAPKANRSSSQSRTVVSWLRCSRRGRSS